MSGAAGWGSVQTRPVPLLTNPCAGGEGGGCGRRARTALAEEEMVLAWALVVVLLGGLGVEEPKEPKEEVPLRLRTEEPNRRRGVLHA